MQQLTNKQQHENNTVPAAVLQHGSTPIRQELHSDVKQTVNNTEPKEWTAESHSSASRTHAFWRSFIDLKPHNFAQGQYKAIEKG